MKEQIKYLSLLLISFILSSIPLNTEENRICPDKRKIVIQNYWEGILNELETLEHIPLIDAQETLDMVIDRGNLRIITGQYKQALMDFDYVINGQSNKTFLNEVTAARALWGRTLSYAFLEKKEEFLRDLYALAELMKLDEKCICCSVGGSNRFCNALNKEKFVEYSSVSNKLFQSDFILCDSFCENTIDNMVAFMKSMCGSIKDAGIHSTLDIFIDGMGYKAKSCCRAGGFWENCVDPMKKIAEKWQRYGIPNDPYWDF